MKNLEIVKNKYYTLYASGLCLGLSFLLMLLSRKNPSFSLWYGKNVFPIFVNTIGRVFSPVPFSIFEMLIYSAIPIILYGVFKLFKNPKSRGRVLLVVSVLFLLFTLNAGINYSRPALLDELRDVKTTSREYSEEELVALYHILLNDIGILTGEIPRDNWELLSLENISLKQEAKGAMKNLTHRFPELSGYYPKPKPVLFSKGMSYLGITGIYSPFTLEANYNSHIPSVLIPFTMCHELAHLKGFMREEEANFIAYLACRDSSSIEFKYSGALNALTYTLSALHKTADLDLYQELVAEIPERVRMEIANNQTYWKSHRKKITEISSKANDTYLKANAQPSGIKSYGLMVELLLEEYKNEKI